MSAKSLAIRIPEHLPESERVVLEMVAAGATTEATAAAMGLSPKTVEYHRLKLMNRAGLNNAAQLTKLALRIGLAEIDV